MTVLVASRVDAGYGPRRVLHGCDLELHSGELIAVVGPNGAGKTTLLRVLAGLIHPTRGSVTLDGRALAAMPRRELARRIAVVPQVLETLFPFTVREIVSLGRTAHLDLLGRLGPGDVEAVDRALATLDLAALSDRRIDTLSGGERQRTVLAMALAQQTEVLLLDEPTVHLDPSHQVATLELVSRMATDRGALCLAVLHDLNLASSFASRVVVVADGRIVRSGSPAETLTAAVVSSVFGDALTVVPGERPAVLPHRSVLTR